MAEDKARDRRESLDSGRERNAVFRSQGPDAARMDFFNGLLSLSLIRSISGFGISGFGVVTPFTYNL